MSFLSKFLVKKNLLIFFLIILLLNSIFEQTFGFANFERAKTSAARWPQLAENHLKLSLTLFNLGSPLYQKELNLAKKSFFWQEKKFSSYLTKLNQPQKIKSEINYLEEWLNQGVQSPEIYLRLSLLYYQLYETENAIEFWTRANFLDPNNLVVKKLGEIVNKL